ncbi:Bax inhibitor-1/YccA family protein [Rhizosaccharibacter radicis]|uniref:Bax inhibitor-1/YccA family protein n=1 Tax=Rhizosaccharibacter radicis TaxID=2782605 RepID=A0ABT1VYK3_9PROT|nr:Bax inhibitor-1/YccA family protein [Acetobacteraceae bacterium KSS12]
MAFSPDYRTTARAGVGAQAGIVDAGLRAYMLRVYNWMTSGLVLTGIVAYGIAHSSLRDLFWHFAATPYGTMTLRPTGLGILAIFAPLAFVLVLSFGVNRLSRQAAQGLFWAFCVAMGASLTNIFFVYTDLSIVRVFFITAATFAAMSLYGYTTKADLTRFGSFLIMGVVGILIAGLVNMFLHSPGLYLAISVLGVLIFTGLTAFDTQRIKWNYGQLAYYGSQDDAAKRSVYDALTLYLNFVNLFQFLLSLTGTRSSNQ